MSVRFERGPTWSAAAPVKVLDARYFTGAGALVGVTYDVSPDGRFLMIRASGESSSSATSPRLVVVQHFDEDLKRLAVN
jgi:hypothetical protein